MVPDVADLSLAKVAFYPSIITPDERLLQTYFYLLQFYRSHKTICIQTLSLDS